MNVPDNATATIADLHELARKCAGLDSTAIAVELEMLSGVTATPEEYGACAGVVQIALDTVRSALVALRDAAIEREKA